MDYRQINETLDLYVRPQTFPLALKLCTSPSELPGKVRMPIRDLGYQVTLCQGIGIARRFRWVLAVGKEDNAVLAEPQLWASLLNGLKKTCQSGLKKANTATC